MPYKKHIPGRHSDGSFAHIECDTIIMDDKSASDTIPFNEILNGNVSMEVFPKKYYLYHSTVIVDHAI